MATSKYTIYQFFFLIFTGNKEIRKRKKRKKEFTGIRKKKIVDSILTFIVNGIFGGGHPGLFPLNSHSFIYILLTKF